MMNRRHSFSFLTEYAMVIMVFAICSSICISIFVSSFHKNRISNLKREALEKCTEYIETGDIKIESFAIGDIEYEIRENDEGFDHYEIIAIYGDEELVDIEFYGGDHE